MKRLPFLTIQPCSSDTCTDGIDTKACHPTHCHKRATQTIHIPKGQTCWSYQGRDTHFLGHFGSWSNVTVVAYGEFFENKKRDVTSLRMPLKIE